MSQNAPFFASLPGKLANAGIALFLGLMAVSAMRSEPKDFDPLFIILTCVVICLFILSVTTAMHDYPKETLFMVCAVPFAAGPMMAWTHIAGGGPMWTGHVLAALGLVFLGFAAGGGPGVVALVLTALVLVAVLIPLNVPMIRQKYISGL